MEKRIEQIERELTELWGSIDVFESKLTELIVQIGALTKANSSANPNAGGQYREELLQFFESHPNEWYSPGGVAKLLGYGKGHPVSIGQACRGLVRSGILVSSLDPNTERPRYKKA